MESTYTVKMSEEEVMFDFDVYYFDVGDGCNHTIINAKYANSAAEFVESTKVGRVFKVECREPEALEEAFRNEVACDNKGDKGR